MIFTAVLISWFPVSKRKALIDEFCNLDKDLQTFNAISPPGKFDAIKIKNNEIDEVTRLNWEEMTVD